MPPQPKKPHTIPTITSALMVATALFYDLLQVGVNFLQGVNAIIPGLGVFLVYLFGIPLTIWAWLTFYLWFKLHGVSFMQPKRFAIMGISGLADTIMSVLPAWTVAVLLLVATTRAEEVLAKVATAAGAAGAAAAVASKVPGTSAAFKDRMKRASESAKQTATQARETKQRLANVRSPT